jgi:sugar/nucleoside kinase (ribokinase family)
MFTHVAADCQPEPPAGTTPMTRSDRAPIVTTGFIALDRVSIDGGSDVLAAAGGSCGNISANLAQLGHTVFPISTLGLDAEGAHVVNELRSLGVRTDFISRRDEKRTPVVVQHVVGRHSIALDHTFAFEQPEIADWLGVSYLSVLDHLQAIAGIPKVLYLDRASSEVLEAVHWAKSIGAIVIFEPSEIGDIVLFRTIADLAHIVKYAERRLRAPPHLTAPVEICTQGSAGLRVRFGQHRHGSAGSDWHHLPAFSIDRLVDSAGAGDALSTGLICALMAATATQTMAAHTILQGLEQGRRLAALNCGSLGARGAFRVHDRDHLSRTMAAAYWP